MTNAALATKPNQKKVKELLRKSISIDQSEQWMLKHKKIEDMTKEEFKQFMDKLYNK